MKMHQNTRTMVAAGLHCMIYGKRIFSEFQKWAAESGYNDTLTIDRIDVNGNYEPGN